MRCCAFPISRSAASRLSAPMPASSPMSGWARRCCRRCSPRSWSRGVVGVACDEAALRRLRPAGALPAAIASVALNIVLENVVRLRVRQRSAQLRSADLSRLAIGRPAARAAAGGERGDCGRDHGGAVRLPAPHAHRQDDARGRPTTPRSRALKGINAAAVARTATFIGMGLAALGGMLIALDTSVGPLSGFDAILAIFAAACSAASAASPARCGRLRVGIGEELSLLVLPALLPRRDRLRRHPHRALHCARRGLLGERRRLMANYLLFTRDLWRL